MPFCIIDQGSKPNLPNDLIKNILPKTPISEFPVKPKENCFLKAPNIFAVMIPMKILIKEIKVPVINLRVRINVHHNQHHPFFL